MSISGWLSNNYIEIFGAVTGIIYVLLEIRQTIWLWPVGIITSAVYIWVFFTSKIYADMSLQVYYLLISVLGWYWWAKGSGRRAQGTEHTKFYNLWCFGRRITNTIWFYLSLSQKYPYKIHLLQPLLY